MVLSHSIAPFDLAQFASVAALIPPRIQELLVDTPNPHARLLQDSGFYGPFTARLDRSGIIEDRDGHPRFLVLPGNEGQSDRAAAAEIVTLALSRLCGFQAADAQTGPMADAAE